VLSAENPNAPSSGGASGPSRSTTPTVNTGSAGFSVLPATPESGNSETVQISLRLPPNTSAHPSSLRFYQLLGELAALHAKKQRDYGRGDDPFANVRASEHFGVPGWIGAIMRGHDKMIRIQSHCLNGSLANESLEDALRDLAVYAIIALVLREQQLAG
jgi:hypothetical protein